MDLVDLDTRPAVVDRPSIWMRDVAPVEGEPFPAGERFDHVVVGAGITGLTTALLLARAGRSVVVLEARQPGAVTTGHSTAKVTQLQGAMFQRIRSRTQKEVLRAYALSQAAAFDWLRDFANSTGVPFERRDAYSYADHPDDRERVEREYRLASEIGLPVELLDDARLPFRTYGAVRLADQAQIDPYALVAALARELRALGGRIVTGARVTGVRLPPRRASDPAVVRTEIGEVSGDRVVLASGIPILDRGLYFTKLQASRSYAQAWSVPGERPDGMFLSVGGPGRSIRTAGDLLVTGGNGHGVGRHPSPRAAADDLAAWTRRWWPGAELVGAWSAQDYLPAMGVPFAGWLPRGRGRVYLATGFSKWGMTNGVATALTLVGDLLGEGYRMSWQPILHRRITFPAAAAEGVGANAAVAAWYARSWGGALLRRAPRTVEEGDAVVGRRGVVPTGVATVDGVTHRVCAVCPHLRAVVQWNDFERSWDCPAHGSRFAPDGAVLEGPAKRGLRPAPSPAGE